MSQSLYVSYSCLLFVYIINEYFLIFHQVGVFLMAIYAMIAAGFNYHENESISTNEELER